MKDDLISRQAAIDALDKHCDIVCQYSKQQRFVMCAGCPLGTAFDVIEQQPTIEAEPVRHGRWEWDRHNGLYYCSECKKKYEYNNVEIMDGEYRYCPNCGAKMEEVDA